MRVSTRASNVKTMKLLHGEWRAKKVHGAEKKAHTEPSIHIHWHLLRTGAVLLR